MQSIELERRPLGKQQNDLRKLRKRAESSCNNPRVGFVNDINHLSTCTAAAGLRRTGVAETGTTPCKNSTREKSAFFPSHVWGALQTPNIAIACGNCGNSPRGWRDEWRIGFMGLVISGDCHPATNVSATNVSGLAK
jgi:hypothetical protein